MTAPTLEQVRALVAKWRAKSEASHDASYSGYPEQVAARMSEAIAYEACADDLDAILSRTASAELPEAVCVGCGIPGLTEVWCAPCRKEHIEAAREGSGMDTMRLNWLDANPRLVIRSGKQHVRPLIDAAMFADYQPPEPDHE